jgi:ABC-type Mn2+/Zn2+ transport system ATPase subunit
VLDSLTISNYRCFQTFRANKLTRVNLLLGKNNSGKTAILEAIMLLATRGDPGILFQISQRRQDELVQLPAIPSVPLVDFAQFVHGRNTAIGQGGFHISPQSGTPGVGFRVEPLGTQPHRDTPPTDLRLPAPDALLRIGSVLDGHFTGEAFIWPMSRSGTILFPPNRFPEHAQARHGAAQHVMYIGPGLPTSQELGSMWGFLQMTRGLEQQVYKIVQLMVPEIVDIAFPPVGSDNHFRGAILVGIEGQKNRIPLGNFGDGVRHLLHLAIALCSVLQGGILLLDEFENGLHYSLMPGLWKAIIQAASERDIQIFAATHSNDCVDALARIAGESSAISSQVAAHQIDNHLSDGISFSGDEIRIAVEHEIEVR